MGDVYATLAAPYGAHGKNAQFYSQIGKALISSLSSLGMEDQGNGRILEIGCGTGLFTALIRATYPEHNIDACDASPAMLDKFDPLLREDLKVVLHLSRIRDLASASCHMDGTCCPHQGSAHGAGMLQAGSYPLVVGNMCFHWLESSDLVAIISLLAPDGIALFSVPVSTPFSRRSGNRLLMKTLMAMRRELADDRSPGFLDDALPAAFRPLRIVGLHTFELSESFSSRQEFADCLWSRGSLHAIFGLAAAQRAHDVLSGRSGGEGVSMELYHTGPWEMDWRISLVHAST